LIPTAQRKPPVQGVLRVQPSFGAHSAGEVPAQVPTAKATARATARATAKATVRATAKATVRAIAKGARADARKAGNRGAGGPYSHHWAA